MTDVRRVLHVLNYGWPHIDGYTVRSSGILTAQQRYLGLDVNVAVSPFRPFAATRDESFVTDAWGPHKQLAARRYAQAEGEGEGERAFERPGLGLAPATSAEFREELKSIALRLSPDLIHVHHPHFIGRVGIDVARELGLPCVYELRCFNGDYDLGRRSAYLRGRGVLYNRLEAATCRRADAVVTISSGLAERIGVLGVDSSRVFVVRNSVDTDRFKRASRPQQGVRTLRLGYACTFSPMEGLDSLVEAVALLSDEQRRRIRITLAGEGSDRARIAELIEKRGLGDTIDLPGFIAYTNMPAFYAELNLLVVPRRPTQVAQATTPLKPLEARASGLPILASDLQALRELLGREAADIRFVEPTPRGLADGIAAFLRSPWSGAESVDETRSWAKEIERYGPIYRAASETARARQGGTQQGWRQRFEKTAKRRLVSLTRLAVDADVPGLTPLRCHVVVCGFPRTGSTLLQLMLSNGIHSLRSFDGEMPALWAARHALRNHAYMLTKLPRDIHRMDAIRDHYRDHHGCAHFVLTLRDPRSVLTSTHQAYPSSHGYYVSFERWQAVYDVFRAEQHAPDVTLLRYEDLINDGAGVGAVLSEQIGWTPSRAFSNHGEWPEQTAVRRDSMTEGALGGLRPLDTSRLESWKDPAHRERLRQMLDAIPAMPDYLIELGYEQDRRWIDELA